MSIPQGTRYAPTQPRTERKMNYQSYLHSEKWRELRAKKIKSCHFKCEGCGTNHGLQVHHLTYKRIFNERMNDLMVLCGDCHAKTHELWKKVPKMQLTFLRACIKHFLTYASRDNPKRKLTQHRRKVNHKHNKLPMATRKLLSDAKSEWRLKHYK